VMLLALNLPLIRVWVKVLEIPRPVLYAGILVFATLGIYSVSGTVTDILIAYAIGILGFFMRQLDFPIAPTILGAILGPQLENQFRRALSVGNGDLTVFVTRPLSLVILLVAAAALLLPYAPRIVARLRGQDPHEARKLAFADEDGGDEARLRNAARLGQGLTAVCPTPSRARTRRTRRLSVVRKSPNASPVRKSSVQPFASAAACQEGESCIRRTRDTSRAVSARDSPGGATRPRQFANSSGTPASRSVGARTPGTSSSLLTARTRTAPARTWSMFSSTPDTATSTSPVKSAARSGPPPSYRR
jgi:hypothetical protein